MLPVYSFACCSFTHYVQARFRLQYMLGAHTSPVNFLLNGYYSNERTNNDLIEHLSILVLLLPTTFWLDCTGTRLF